MNVQFSADISNVPRAREHAFTLIELLVVMIIIAILMAVAIPTFLAQKDNAKATVAKKNIKLIIDAATSCAISNPDGSYNGTSVGGIDCTDETVLLRFEKGLSSLKFVEGNLPGPGQYRIHDSPTWPIVVRTGVKTRAGWTFIDEYHDSDGTVHRRCIPANQKGVCNADGSW